MKLLVLDGGGVFGLAQAKILKEVDAFNKFDAFIGTSIGAANAAIIASNNNIDATDFFYEKMPKIFDGHWWRKYKPITPKYKDIELNNALKELFSTTKLGDVKKPLFICAVNILTEQLKVFYSGDSYDGSNLLWEIVRCSTAAPTYFNPYKGFTDGGIYANYPVIPGIAGVADEFGINIQDIEVCSIGTGLTTNHTEINKSSYFSWGIWLLQAMLKGSSSSMNDFIARQLPLKKYTRIQFLRDPSWCMDSATDMLKIETAWDKDINKAIQKIKEF